ncbi:hypothetical protein BH11PLA1_BH11PLA1_21410 [soil metagenome]
MQAGYAPAVIEPAASAAPLLLAQASAAAPQGPMLSSTVALALGGPMIIAAGLYTLLIQRVHMPASRRRLRTASGILLMLTLGALVYALTAVSTATPRTFVIAWCVVVALTGVLLLLALLDLVNTARLHSAQRARLAEQQAARMVLEARARIRARRAGGADVDTLGAPTFPGDDEDAQDSGDRGAHP